MIARLKNIYIRGFRSFHSPELLPLDSDVVLIYGKNGSGKTGLMSAIEFALTGTVLDLAKYTTDYPRCLRNVRWKSQVVVDVTVATESQPQATIGRCIDGSSVGTRGEIKLTKEESRSFVEKCYLSQSRLSRLLELYQATDKDSPEQLLVRFARELLGLDLLENIIAGLHEAADIRRLENACANLDRLKHEQSIVEASIQDLVSRAVDDATSLQSSLQAAKLLLSEVGDPFPNERWNVEGLQKRRGGLEGRSVLPALQKVQEFQGRLNRIVGFLQAADAKTITQDKDKIKDRLSHTQNRRADLETMLGELVSGDYERIPQITNALHQLPNDASVLRRIAVLETAVQRVAVRYEDEVRLQRDAERELAAQHEQTERLKSLLGRIDENFSSTGLDSQRRNFEMLRNIVDHVHGEDCPVCGRNYSEVSPDGLKSKIQKQIDKLGLDIQKLEVAVKQRTQLQDTLTVAIQREDAVAKRLADIGSRITQFSDAYEEAQRIGKRLDTVKQQRSDLELAMDETNAVEAQLKTLEIQSRQQEQATQELKLLADEIGIGTSDEPSTSFSLVERVSAVLRQKVEELQQSSNKQRELVEVLSNAEVAAANVERVKKRLAESKARLELIKAKKENVDSSIGNARRLSQAAGTAKTKLLNQIFHDSLNTLWKSLFARLARFENFIPQLGNPTLSRGKIETHIAGTMPGIASFANFAAVSSMGNLNTAALSLFLALNLVEKPKHRILLLDDPVQNMDDMHIIQFASLVRAIAYQTKRQVVLAVHERALFDYLSLELGPSREGDSLMAIEIAREEGTEASQLQFEKRTWKEDMLRFGT